MNIEFKPSAIKQTKWYEYGIRFLFGGLVTVFTGLITAKFGPVVGGLFLAFPSILPASLTLVQKHKKEKEQQEGTPEQKSLEAGKESAAQTAHGTMLASSALAVFGLVIWIFSNSLPPWLILIIALAGWLTTAVTIWWLLIGRTGKKG
jgi:hypothetical protein